MKRFMGTALGACLLLALAVSSAQAQEKWPFATASQSGGIIDITGIGASGANIACWAEEDGAPEVVVTSDRGIFGGYINGTSTLIPPTCTGQLNAYSGTNCGAGTLLFQSFLNVPGCTPTTPPAAPGGIGATAVSATSVLVSWTDNSNNEAGFQVKYCEQGVNCVPSGPQVLFNPPVGQNIQSQEVTGLDPNTPYTFKVCAFNSSGAEACSGTADAATFGPPAGPTGINAVALSPTEVKVSWNDNSTKEDGFNVYFCETGVNCGGGGDPTQLAGSVGPNQTMFTHTGRDPETQYTYKACAFNTAGESCSGTDTATTPGPPANPGGIDAAALSATEIKVSWTDNSNSEDGFNVYFCETGVNCGGGGDPNQLAGTVGPNQTMFTHTGRDPETQYTYKACAFNTAGESCSGTDTATTPGPPANPTGIDAAALSATEIKVSWTDNSNNEDGFNVYFCETGVNCGGGGDPNQLAGTVGPNQTMFTHTGRDPETQYTYKACAFNAGGEACSGTDTATTPAIPAPSNPIAVALSSSQIELQWDDNSSDEDGFNIYRCQGMGCTDFLFHMTVPANTTNYVDEGLPGDTFFRYNVTALINPESAPSNNAGTTTLDGGQSLPRQTGQITCYDSSGNTVGCGPAGTEGQDGEQLAGQPWPSPRFEDAAAICGSQPGVFLDKLTQKCYMKNMCETSCQNTGPWYPIVCDAVGCNAGGGGAAPICDDTADASCRSACTQLSDGSVAGEWRVANAVTAATLIDYSMVGHPSLPALPQELIDMLSSDELNCWDQLLFTSTTANAGDLTDPHDFAYTVDWVSNFGTGALLQLPKTGPFRGLLVKDAQ